MGDHFCLVVCHVLTDQKVLSFNPGNGVPAEKKICRGSIYSQEQQSKFVRLTCRNEQIRQPYLTQKM
ncbi:hypothetical protein TNCV_1943591 [Trichonephila clavipes]|nr:hypothetical protein TNCV_1943591 [Trichonephila clavipes]